MPPQISALMQSPDNVETICEKIASILKEESANQEALATAASEDPKLWALRVFLDRANPWEHFIFEESEVDGVPSNLATPIVNVAFDRDSFDASKSNVVERQKCTAIFNVDCYGYGVSEGTVGGHLPGDREASRNAKRALRLCRQILMASHYTYLDMKGVVSRRWTQSRQMFQPPTDGRYVQQLIGARLELHVDFNEFSPQYVGEPLEHISTTVTNEATGEVFLTADYQFGP